METCQLISRENYRQNEGEREIRDKRNKEGKKRENKEGEGEGRGE